MPVDPPAPFHPTATRRVRETVRVGVAVIVVASNDHDAGDDHDCNDDTTTTTPRIYAGIRIGSHGAGTLALPGGHLELYENWDDCARREVLEEMNVHLHDLQFLHVTNDPMPDDNKHYVTIFMAGRIIADQVVTTMEPDKCQGWQTFSVAELQTIAASKDPDECRLFGPLARLVQDDPPALKAFLASCSSTTTTAYTSNTVSG